MVQTAVTLESFLSPQTPMALLIYCSLGNQMTNAARIFCLVRLSVLLSSSSF